MKVDTQIVYQNSSTKLLHRLNKNYTNLTTFQLSTEFYIYLFLFFKIVDIMPHKFNIT